MPMIPHLSSNERGFTIAELLVAMVVTLLVVGGAVTMTTQVQNGYRRQLEETAAEQEGRYALDWVSRLLRAAGNNPYNVTVGDCQGATSNFLGLDIPANVNNRVIIQTDSNPPDRLLGGPLGTCNQPNEYVEVSHDAAQRTVLFRDIYIGGGADIRTEPVVTNLQFIYRDGSHNVLANPVNPVQVMYVETRITVQPRAIGNQGGVTTRTMSQEVRIKGRNF